MDEVVEQKQQVEQLQYIIQAAIEHTECLQLTKDALKPKDTYGKHEPTILKMIYAYYEDRGKAPGDDFIRWINTTPKIQRMIPNDKRDHFYGKLKFYAENAATNIETAKGCLANYLNSKVLTKATQEMAHLARGDKYDECKQAMKETLEQSERVTYIAELQSIESGTTITICHKGEHKRSIQACAKPGIVPIMHPGQWPKVLKEATVGKDVIEVPYNDNTFKVAMDDKGRLPNTGSFRTIRIEEDFEDWKEFTDLIAKAPDVKDAIIRPSGESIHFLKQEDSKMTDWAGKSASFEDYLFQDCIVEKSMNLIHGPSGCGKSLFELYLGIHSGLGVPIFGWLKPTRDLKILMITMEDSENELHRRVHRITKQLNLDRSTINRMASNFFAYSMWGKLGSMFESEGNNIKTTIYFEWLQRTLDNYQDFDLLILDPLSRICLLPETNEVFAAVINYFEMLIRERGITMLLTHHDSKSMENVFSQYAARGGSSLVAGVRTAIAMTWPSQKMAKRLDIDPEDKGVVLTGLTKNNVGRSGAMALYRMGKDGTFELAQDLDVDQVVMREKLLDRAMIELHKTLTQSYRKEDRYYTRTELGPYHEIGKDIRKDIQDKYGLDNEEYLQLFDRMAGGDLAEWQLQPSGKAHRPSELFVLGERGITQGHS